MQKKLPYELDRKNNNKLSNEIEDLKSKIQLHSRNFHGNWCPPSESYFSKETFNRTSLKRAKILSCKFENVAFKRVSGVGSYWENCQFIGCSFENNGFEKADFTGAVFDEKTKIQGGAFSYTYFDKAKFLGCTLEATSLMGCSFSNSVFDRCKITSCCMNNATFDQAKLSHINLANTNIEYVDFSGAILEEVKVSLAQFPFLFGIKSEQIQNKSILISTRHPKYSSGVLHWNDLVEIVPSIIKYHASNNNFFPQANLMFMSGFLDGLDRIIESGISACFRDGRVNDLIYLAKLAGFSGIYSKQRLHYIYDRIMYSPWGESKPFIEKLEKEKLNLKKYLFILDEEDVVDISMYIVNTEDSFDDMLPWILKKLQEGCFLQGEAFSWEWLESTISSPGHLRGKVKLGKNHSEEVEKNRARREKISLFLNAMAVIFSAAPVLATLDNTKKEQLEQIRIEIQQRIILDSFYVKASPNEVFSIEGQRVLNWTTSNGFSLESECNNLKRGHHTPE